MCVFYTRGGKGEGKGGKRERTGVRSDATPATVHAPLLPPADGPGHASGRRRAHRARERDATGAQTHAPWILTRELAFGGVFFGGGLGFFFRAWAGEKRGLFRLALPEPALGGVEGGRRASSQLNAGLYGKIEEELAG